MHRRHIRCRSPHLPRSQYPPHPPWQRQPLLGWRHAPRLANCLKPSAISRLLPSAQRRHRTDAQSLPPTPPMPEFRLRTIRQTRPRKWHNLLQIQPLRYDLRRRCVDKQIPRKEKKTSAQRRTPALRYDQCQYPFSPILHCRQPRHPLPQIPPFSGRPRLQHHGLQSRLSPPPHPPFLWFLR